MDALDLASDIAKPFESLKLKPYHDPVGYPTVGYGHLLSRNLWENLSKYSSVTEAEALDLLELDMKKARDSVKRLIKVPLSLQQEAALIDFTFNCGGGNLQISRLRMRLNKSDYLGAAEELNGTKWVYANKIRLPGLVRRRRLERAVFLNGTS